MKDIVPDRLRRVLFLARGGRIHGSQRQLQYLVGALDRKRLEPIVAVDRPGPLASALDSAGVQTHVMPMRAWRSFPARMLRYFDALAIARLARKRGVDLVHASDVWRSGYMHFTARRLGIPSVLHIRGPLPERDILKHQVARASGVIAIAQRYRQDLASSGVSPDHLDVIDDAVDLERFRPGLAGRGFLAKRFGVDGEMFVGLVGRLDPFKRVIEFLEAICPLARSHSGVKYLAIGQAGRKPYRQAVQAAVRRLGLQKHVIFADHDEDISKTIAAMDILATMSGGSVMFEAMACATPVLSVRVDGMHSVHTRHDETAWCVTTDRPEPVTAALARLIDDADLRERLGRAGRAWTQQHLSISNMAARTQAVYDRLLEC